MSHPVFFTVGYGGRTGDEFLTLLTSHGVKRIVDIRLTPRGAMGLFTKAKTPEKGIEALLARAGIGYLHLPEFGNPFYKEENWREPFQTHLKAVDPAAFERLAALPEGFCLLCGCKRLATCHREYVAALLEGRGFEARHIE